MLHQTLPLYFHFNACPSSPTPSSQFQVKPEMEGVETKALKTSFWPEMTVKSTQEAFFEDVLGGINGPNGGVSGDDFFVDDLLDFSKEECFVAENEEEEEKGNCPSASSNEKNSNSSWVSLNDDFGSIPASELSVPADDLASLEWLSHFVEDCFSEFSPTYTAGNPISNTQASNLNRSERETETSLKTVTFPTRVPAKARSKRSRSGGRVWSLGSPSFAETPSSSSSSASSASSPLSSSLLFTNPAQNLELFYNLGKPPAKKQKTKPVMETCGTQMQRRCSHCGVQKTPQWRTGPLGAKTLCNACGVRYKSGRLLPEYRPACSPTFSSDVHSNSHRKVLEMRRKKEIAPAESGLASAVQSF